MSKNKTDYIAPLRGIWALVARLLTQAVTLFVPRIKDDEQRLIVNGLLTASQQTVGALSDANPNDKEQLQSILNGLLRDGDFRKGAQAELVAKINALENPDIRTALTIMNQEIYTVGDLLTDDVPANDEQMGVYLEAQLRGGNGLLLLRALFGIVLKNDQYADTAAALVSQLLLISLEDEGADEGARLEVAAAQSTYEERLQVAA